MTDNLRFAKEEVLVSTLVHWQKQSLKPGAEGQHLDIAAIDLAKAYNTVWRNGVLEQLRDWRIQGSLGIYIQQFLTNRRFRVAIGGTFSNFFSEDNGVPQGSVLSVTLFLIAMNSIYRYLPKGIHIFVYADDILLVVTGLHPKRVRRKLQAAVNAIGRWAEQNGFNVSTSKSEITHLCGTHHRATDRPVTLNGYTLRYRKEPVILGVSIDRTGTFGPHFRRVKNDCKSRRRLVRAISNRHRRTNRHTILNISQSLITSKILYGIELTRSSSDLLVRTLAPVYNGSIRSASSLLPSSPTEASCVESGLLPFPWFVASSIIKRAVAFVEKTTGNDCCLLNTARNVYNQFTGEDLPEIANVPRVFRRSWYDRGPNINLSLTKKIKAGDPPGVILAQFNKLASKYGNHLKLYTDGSKLDDQVGFGVHGLDIYLARKLPASCSVFSAEAAAILLATLKKPPDIPVVIFSDSLSVLNALDKGISRHPFVQAIEDALDPLTTLCWIP
ncbi:uncharacterized protein LOC131680668 [Topomyia yanbarensis]|uniref:uncharacterized protein LOC131680668 n=1 Tax=Topomyia yanbarensis TaxID=2498891 RepID=UPI00273B426C|nr:uncharacterized protein LOC131680668 [Topomyia yanbarensis]